MDTLPYSSALKDYSMILLTGLFLYKHAPTLLQRGWRAPGVSAHGNFPSYTEVYTQIDNAKLPVINEYSRKRFHVQICLGSARL